MLTKRAFDVRKVLKTYKDIRAGKKVADDERSLAKAHLKISGVVRRQDEWLVPRNRIYEIAFDLAWVKEHLPRIERRTVVLTLGTISVLALTLAGLGVTGYLNKIIYNPMAAQVNLEWADVPAGEFTMGSTPEQVDQAFCKLSAGNLIINAMLDWYTPEMPATSV